ncbi:MAG TPA: 3-deoxy-7-phosphoheptulonate synthase [Gemmatimonadales bacterium]|jgi:chorismate mutase/prephenate dehydratase|nr:3-deoxy-7-phosphoheptulonate synthase [Gemmatimonadales bacterium]
MRVAIQGTHGSFSEAAARRRWPGLITIPCREAKDVVDAVRSHQADAGCLPIENSLIGSVTTTYDQLEEAFGDGTLRLSHEILYPVHHTLMGMPGAALSGIRRVLSHPVALGQCRLWLSEHLPDVELVSAWDTAGSAEMVAEQKDPTWAAVAARHAADAHGLVPLAERIEDDPTNQTRFLAFSRSDASALPPGAEGTRRYKTSLIVLIDHRPGMLALTLQAFGVRGVNLMALQSRPERSAPWTYRFYVDIDGATADPRVAEALEEVEALAARVVVLGSYEAWVEGSRLSAPPPTPAHHTRKPDIPLIDRRRNPEGSRIQVGRLTFGGDERVLIAGPCSVESESMILETAAAVAQAGGDMLRGGAYKPRTSPYDFQGLGVKGLRYLADAREKTGLPVVTEVLSWEEVAVVGHFADMLQIGARNMQNFSLLRAASRSGKPILLKRGAGATIEEWLMAAEYVLAEGNPNVVLCERGIRTFERATRHTLDLNAVAMVLERSHLPVIVDPSHAAGVRSLVTPLSLGSLAAGACGLIVEVHPNPDQAMSDGAQSLDMAMFAELARQVHPQREARVKVALA